MAKADPSTLNPTARFTSRVADYVKYRPGYPIDIIELLTSRCGLTTEWTVADIGSGPGNLTRLFLDNGNPVFGVEPNGAMREAGENLLSSYQRFTSVPGTAEETTLAEGSIDLIVAGQAFHWFSKEPTRLEFERILKPGGWVALIWNDRNLEADRFATEYERILCEMAPEYTSVKSKYESEQEIEEFFCHLVRQATFPSFQAFDREGFLGRVLSSSYVPQAGQPGHERIMDACSRLFDEEQQGGEARFVYDTQVFFGQL